MLLFFDKEGNPIEDIIRYAELCEDATYRYVKQETLPNGIYLSTIWVGLDMSMNCSKIIFETAAFIKDNVEVFRRVETLEEATVAHEDAVKKYGDFT